MTTIDTTTTHKAGVATRVARIISARGYDLPAKNIVADFSATLLDWHSVYDMAALVRLLRENPDSVDEAVADAIMRTADADALAPAMTTNTGPDYTSAITNALRDLIHSEKD